MTTPTPPLTPDQFPALLGLTELDAPLVATILARVPGAPGATELSQRQLRAIRAGFVAFKDLGVVLSFSEREDYVEDFGEPRGAGTQVLGALFYYPEGSEEVDAFEGVAPFADEPVPTREDALRAYGEPDDADEEDGVVEWEQWQLEGYDLSLDYAEDGAVLTLTVTPTMVEDEG